VGDLNAAAIAGVASRGYQRGAGSGPWDQYVIPTSDKLVSYDGRGVGNVVPGRAAVRQVLGSLHNAAGSAVLVSVTGVKVDVLWLQAALAIGIQTPVIRLARFSGAPTGGTAVAKGSQDTALASSASVICTSDASADGTLSGTAMAVTTVANLAQVWAPRFVQATTTAGNSAVAELVDVAAFLESSDAQVVLRPGEGLAVVLDLAVVTTGNPSTARWLCTMDWLEYTRP